MIRVVVAEDEAKARRYLARGLGEEGFSVSLAEDGETALALLRGQAFDVAVLDIMLPRRDGWSIVQTLRAEAIHTPVLFLTARDRVEDRVRGFELGGNDYLIKPFAFAELLARLRNLTRASGPSAWHVGELVINTLDHQVTRQGQSLRLAPKEYALLLLLARHRGQALSRSIIAERVWGIRFDTRTNIVDVVVKRLREKLDAPFASPPLLHTVRGTGYKLDDSDV